jgi:hypothetical protein
VVKFITGTSITPDIKVASTSKYGLRPPFAMTRLARNLFLDLPNRVIFLERSVSFFFFVTEDIINKIYLETNVKGKTTLQTPDTC